MQAAYFGMRIHEVPARGRYFEEASSVGFRSGVVYGTKTLWAGARLVLHRARSASLPASSSRVRAGRWEVDAGRHRRARGPRPRAGSTPPGNGTWPPTRCAEHYLPQRAHRRRRLRGRAQLPGSRAPRDGRDRPGRGCARWSGPRDPWSRTCAACPFPAARFDGAIAVHSIEHVPDPERALAEMAPRAEARWRSGARDAEPADLRPARRDHRPLPLRRVRPRASWPRCAAASSSRCRWPASSGRRATGSSCAAEHAKLDALLGRDPLRMRRLIPRRARQRLYDWRLSRERAEPDPGASAITVADFTLETAELDRSLDIVAVCRPER